MLVLFCFKFAVMILALSNILLSNTEVFASRFESSLEQLVIMQFSMLVLFCFKFAVMILALSNILLSNTEVFASRFESSLEQLVIMQLYIKSNEFCCVLIVFIMFTHYELFKIYSSLHQQFPLSLKQNGCTHSTTLVSLINQPYKRPSRHNPQTITQLLLQILQL
ncbi:Hypothetical_protein [Hexamita inflata]|uniref:Hypothetical_protein n=1 Tax=Hexamita inflata TaxID=28002 RepID=A0AA86RCT0_9EUKA|nr:Hypothetical protein HINF_LOCUS58313 [Hexamita inflata]